MSKGRFLFETGLYACIAGLTAYAATKEPMTFRSWVFVALPVLTVIKAKLSPGSKKDEISQSATG